MRTDRRPWRGAGLWSGPTAMVFIHRGLVASCPGSHRLRRYAMTTTTSTAVVVYDPGLVDPEHVALEGFLGGYRGLTRDAYALDLRQFVAFCELGHLRLFEVRRSDIETFGRELKARGRATATIARRLCTITGFYRYAEEEGLIAHSPAVHVRRHRIDYESHVIGLDRNEVGALLVAGAQRTAGVRGDWGRNRGPRCRTRTSDAHHRSQGRKDRHDPARAAHRSRRRPGHRRTVRWPDLHGRGRPAPRPPRRSSHRPACRPPGRHRQADRPPHASTR